MNVKQKPLTIEVIAHSAPLSRQARMLSQQRFDNLPDAIVFARSLGNTCKARVAVRGRRGNAHFVFDGAAQQPKKRG